MKKIHFTLTTITYSVIENSRLLHFIRKGGPSTISESPSETVTGKAVTLPSIDIRDRVLCCINAVLARKAHNLVVMKVDEISSFADYFLICSGASDRQVKALCSSIQESLKKTGMAPLGIEGEKHGRWVLMDYGDVIIHIFFEPLREFYDIERLWTDAPKMLIPDDTSLVTDLDEGL